MKKYLSLILMLCVLAIITGCASSKTETVPETTEAVTEAAVVETEPETTETCPAPVDMPDPADIVDHYIDNVPQKGDPTAVIGDYMDLTSQRARMTLDYDFEKDIYICEVTWANSATEQEVWKMHWTDIGNGKYVYDDGEHLKVTYAENGEATTTVLAQNQTGFFTYDNADDLRVTETAILDRFFWDGAADENCRTCHFEQME